VFFFFFWPKILLQKYIMYISTKYVHLPLVEDNEQGKNKLFELDRPTLGVLAVAMEHALDFFTK